MENKEHGPDATGTVPDKQIHRWKDDGGPVIVEPDDEPEQDASDKD